MNSQHFQTQENQTVGWQGKLQVSYGAIAGETRILQSQVQAPLKVQRPFYPEGSNVCHSVILHTAGGVVGGDRLSLNLDLQPDAHALITTAAAGKIYRSNGLEARQIIKVSLAPNARLEWLPQETIVFEQAQYCQEMQIELAPGAIWMGWDITRFGRTARGEKFLAGEWRSRTEVWQQGRPLWIDRQWLPGNEETFHSPHGLAGCPVVGSFAFVGRSLDPELIEKIRATWSGNPGKTGTTRLQAGLLCRYRGHSTSDAQQWFLHVWQILRLAYLERQICVPRVWQQQFGYPIH
ncbi:MAG: urease accessory protein UreD [Oscillatoriales cyanobacterium C42_A2020_001]|nr:urease accessory protein UreD [Leptolyngbyaceae cyanobacterium C42_A2020_001]